MEQQIAVIGTNSWGNAMYSKLLRGSTVTSAILDQTVATAKEMNMTVFDVARDYGFGHAQKTLGQYAAIQISAKYTPLRKHKKGKVTKSFYVDLQDLNRASVEYYWLHLPTSIEENLHEIISLYKDGKIKHIGVSNFNLEECKRAKQILDQAGIPLYGVQNHYSLLSRTWEQNGLLAWCHDNEIAFWGYAVLEEGLLIGPPKKESFSIMKAMYRRKRKKLLPLFHLMKQIGDNYNFTIAQVAIAYCSSKGVIPVSGCRRPYQVKQLHDAAITRLTDAEVIQLEELSEQLDVHFLGADVFRFAVRK